MKEFTKAKRKYIVDLCMEDLRKEVEKGIDRIHAMTDRELAATKEYNFNLDMKMDYGTLKLIRLCLQEDPGDLEPAADEPDPVHFTRWKHYKGGRYISTSKLATNVAKHTETGEELRLERNKENGKLEAVPASWQQYTLPHPVEAALSDMQVLVAKHAKTGEDLVIYAPEASSEIWARPYDMFFSPSPGTSMSDFQPRFMKVPN